MSETVHDPGAEAPSEPPASPPETVPGEATPTAPDTVPADTPRDPNLPVPAEKNPAPGLDIGQAEAQARMDVATEQGYIGGTPDPTPNENYSLQTPPEAPTPETDADLYDQAHATVGGNPLRNTGLSTAQTEEVFMGGPNQ